jgi:arabinose-5-phosphate isomerase
MKQKLSTVERAKEVLRIEANGILELINRINEKFHDAVELLYRCKGRVVVTGVGKPGIIGRKFSATLASTGTPSLWMHPVEAVHGDMGMVVKDDVVVAISNSGETEELVRLIPLIKKTGAKLIALSGNNNSTLSKRADICLDVSVSREACTLGLIPTSSTTAALAMCDALSVSLLEKKGFDLKDYAFYHPGGMIGRKLLQVKELMRGGRFHAIVKEDEIVKNVLIAITEAKAGSATVVDNDGKVCGIFTDGDLRRNIEKDPMITKKQVSKVMTKNPISIHMDTLAFEALRIIKDKKIDELVVVDDNKRPVGLVDEKDLLGIG